MRQSDFTIGVVRHRRACRRKRLLLLAVCDAPLTLQWRTMKRHRRARRDVRLLTLRSRHIAVCSFNLTFYSNNEPLKRFKFQIKDIPRSVDAMNVMMERTRRNSYRCDSVTASCIVLRRLAWPCRWSDVAYMFVLRSSALSEVFWEALEAFIGSKGHLITQLKLNFLS